MLFFDDVPNWHVNSKSTQEVEEAEAMRQKPKIFYHPIDGSAPLSISWYPGPYGDAHEAKGSSGVYFTAPNGEILSVQFDDVSADKDHQELTLPNGEKVAVDVVKGKVKVHRSKATRKTG